MIARRWKNRCRRDANVNCRDLKSYLAFIGYERPAHLGERQSTQRIRHVRDMLARRGEYDALTAVPRGNGPGSSRTMSMIVRG